MKKTSKPKQTVYEIVTQRMIDYIEQYQDLPWMKPWATVESPQRNFITMNPYKGINALLTGMSGYSSPSGCHSSRCAKREADSRRTRKELQFYIGQHLKRRAMMKRMRKSLKSLGSIECITSLMQDQIEGIEFPEFELPKYDFNPIDEAERIIESMPKRPIIEATGKEAYYSPMFDMVTVPHPERFNPSVEFYGTLFHELAHSTGHPSRLNRFKEECDNHQFGGQSYSKEELVAEMSSAFILNTLGINTKKTDYNSARVSEVMVEKAERRPKNVVTAASKAGKAANYIMGKEA